MPEKKKRVKKNNPGQGRKSTYQSEEEKTKAKYKSNRKYYDKHRQVTLRLNPEVHAAIAVLAASVGLSVNKFLIQLISRGVEK